MLARLDWRTSIVGGAAQVLAVTALAQLLALGLQLLVARILGPVEFGAYGFVLAGLALCLMVAKLGLDVTLVREAAQLTARGEPARLRGLVRLTRIAGPGAALLVAVLALAAASLSGELAEPAVRRTLLVGALLLPVAVLSELSAATLRGLRRVPMAVAGDGLVRPLVAAGLLAIAGLSAPAALSGALALGAYLGGTVASLALTWRLLGPLLPAGPALLTRAEAGSYLSSSLSLMLATGILTAMYSLDTVMLGVISGTTTAGFYSVASRIAIVVLFVMNGAQMVVAPMLAAAAGGRQPAELRHVVRTLNGLSLVAAIPATIVLVVAAGPVLGLFGPEFREAAPALRLLAVSQLLNVFTGPTGLVLSMTGNERSLVRLLVAGLALNVVLNVAFIPAYGAPGAALASLIAHAAWNLMAVVVIRSRLGLDVTPFDLLRRPGVA